jgi:hypothetical protein
VVSAEVGLIVWANRDSGEVMQAVPHFSIACPRATYNVVGTVREEMTRIQLTPAHTTK